MSRYVDWMKDIHPDNPYRGFPADRYPVDLQGWNYDSPIFEHVISTYRPLRMVEVGSWKGASANHIAQLMKQYLLEGPQLICVDTWLGSIEHWINRAEPTYSLNLEFGKSSLYNQFLANAIHSNNDDIIVPFPIDSNTAAKYLQARGFIADAIYVDGGHDYDSVMADLVAYWKILKPGGVLFGDDYILFWIGVVRAVHDFADRLGITVNLSFYHKYLLEKPIVEQPAVPPASAAHDRDVALQAAAAAQQERDAARRERDEAVGEANRWFQAVTAVDHNPLARAFRKQGSWRNVVRRLNGGHPSPIVLAERARDAAKWELATRYYRDALDIEPHKPEIWAQFGHALKNTGKLAEAEMVYEISRELSAGRPHSAASSER